MNTPLRSEIREIIFKASGGISDMANEEIDQILELVASKMPEEKIWRQPVGEYDRSSEEYLELIRMSGYNSAITEVKSILKGGTDNGKTM